MNKYVNHVQESLIIVCGGDHAVNFVGTGCGFENIRKQFR